MIFDDEDSFRKRELIDHTMATLVKQNRASLADVYRIREIINSSSSDSRYVLKHLSAHLGIAGLRIAIPVLPVGSLLRFGWVFSWRVLEIIRGRMVRARHHSVTVLFVALVPFLGYFAYVVALKRIDPVSAWFYANHISLIRFGDTYDAIVERRSKFMQRVMRLIATPPMEIPSRSATDG